MKQLLFLTFLFLQTTIFAQIHFSIEPQADGLTYHVKLKPDQSFDGRMSITNTAQVSFVVPTGGFQVGNIVNFNGKWQNTNNVIAPTNNPQKDYLVFNLLGHMKSVTYTEDEEVMLFSFENIGEKTGKPRFVNKSDIKIIKTQQLNIGNQISVLGAGFRNAFSGTYVADTDEEEETYEEGPEMEESHVLYGSELPETFELDINVVKEGITLEWLAQNKGKIKSFVIEKSMDGINFEPIRTIQNADEAELKEIDDAPDYGTNYYRVKQQFTSGDYQYSTVQSEQFLIDDSAITIYPNPVKDNFNLKVGHFTNLEGNVHIFNMQGIEMANKPLAKSEKRLSINTTTYQNGIYFLIINAKGKKIVERQFIVENVQ